MEHRGPLGQWKDTLYGTVMVDICCYITYSSKPIQCITPRVNPNVNSGLWVMICLRETRVGYISKRK